jgi:hypothetical protein
MGTVMVMEMVGYIKELIDVLMAFGMGDESCPSLPRR